jgi:hypothetical protein
VSKALGYRHRPVHAYHTRSSDMKTNRHVGNREPANILVGVESWRAIFYELLAPHKQDRARARTLSTAQVATDWSAWLETFGDVQPVTDNQTPIALLVGVLTEAMGEGEGAGLFRYQFCSRRIVVSDMTGPRRIDSPPRSGSGINLIFPTPR